MVAADADVTVLVVDDQALFRSVARAVVERTPGFRIVAEVASGEEAIVVAAAVRPDVVLMDIHLPGLSGIDATRQLVDRGHPVVLLVSTYCRRDLPADASTCGAAAYAHKEQLTPALLGDLWSVHRPAAG
jgi:two-component system, NarL family, invasion response regulator UvrY